MLCANEDGRGRHFDSDIVNAFLDHFGEFVAIAERYCDAGGPPEIVDLLSVQS